MAPIARTAPRAVAAPSSTTKAMDTLIGRFTNRLEDIPGDYRRKLLSVRAAPDDREREQLETRRAELRASLLPTPGDDADDVIYGILAGGNTFGASGEEIDVKVRLYAEALRSEPTWAIEKARQTFGRGGWKCAWDGRGVPSSANVVAECRFILLQNEEELHRISLILDAIPVDNDTTEDQRYEALAHWADIRAGIARHNVIAQRTEAEISTERRLQAEANARFEGRDYKPLSARRGASTAPSHQETESAR